ncbi:MAG TPA: YfiR family protein [Opitutaceae bacterium]|nr:YfiR family protein [Opitutaceae bacterium]
MALLRSPLRRARLRLALALAAAAAVAAPLGGAAEVSREYQVKAAFLYNFAQFVEWPARAFPTADAPLTIGILGDDPFDGVLDEILRGEVLHGHRVRVRRAQHEEELADCQLVFISQSEKPRLARIMARLAPRPVLTVSEVAGFAQQGGMVNFYREGSRVRFELNPAAARREGLRFSSQLMSVGKIVESAPGAH